MHKKYCQISSNIEDKIYTIFHSYVPNRLYTESLQNATHVMPTNYFIVQKEHCYQWYYLHNYHCYICKR
jgi:hypothetical protein